MQQKIEWGNSLIFENKVSFINPNTIIIRKIQDYVEGQIKNFLKENHISEKRWFKYGVIGECQESLEYKSYILYYKTPFRKLKRKVTVEYNMVV